MAFKGSAGDSCLTETGCESLFYSESRSLSSSQAGLSKVPGLFAVPRHSVFRS
jgi:hypothetical protein